MIALSAPPTKLWRYATRSCAPLGTWVSWKVDDVNVKTVADLPPSEMVEISVASAHPTPAWPTVRVSGVERWPAVPLPSTVRKYTPGSTAPSTLSVRVELVPVGAAGANEPVIPAEAPPRLNVTGSVKLVRVRLTVVVP